MHDDDSYIKSSGMAQHEYYSSMLENGNPPSYTAAAFGPNPDYDTGGYRTPDRQDEEKVASASPKLNRSITSIRKILQQKNGKLPKFSISWIFLLSIYSTVLSTFWFLVAIIRPHWGSFVAINGSLSPSAASTLAAFFARTIEMSFTTILIVCLGQYLTARAKEKGIRTSDLQLKTIIVLPGSILTQEGGFRALWRRGLLGLGCVIAFLVAAFYTTASDALVSPRASLSNPVVMPLLAKVQASFGNVAYIRKNCPLPGNSTNIRPADEENCVITQHSGAALHNYMQFLSFWKPTVNETRNFTLQDRPPPQGLWREKLPVQGLWLDSNWTLEASQRYGRLITSTLMAMPHIGVVASANMAENNITRLYDKQNNEQLKIEATTVAPAINITCASVTEEELIPITYTRRPELPPLTPTQFLNTEMNATKRNNATAFDDVFGFHDNATRPIFYTIPFTGQTEIDAVGTYRNMLYILMNSSRQASDEYTLCSMKLDYKSGCSTVFTTNVTGSRLSLNCDANNPMRLRYQPSLSGSAGDWVVASSLWGLGLPFSAGARNDSTAIGSILNKLAPISLDYDPTQPSLTDSLAILAASTLLSSAVDAPLDGVWSEKLKALSDPSTNIISHPQFESFQAQIQHSDYSSGAIAPWENIFVLILLGVCLLNIICLAYLLILSFGRVSISKHGRIKRLPPKKVQKDVTDLHELFATAISSPRINMTGNGEQERLLKKKDRDSKWNYTRGIFVPADAKEFRLRSSTGLGISETAPSTTASSPMGRGSKFKEHMSDAPSIPIEWDWENHTDDVFRDYQRVLSP